MGGREGVFREGGRGKEGFITLRLMMIDTVCVYESGEVSPYIVMHPTPLHPA